MKINKKYLIIGIVVALLILVIIFQNTKESSTDQTIPARSQEQISTESAAKAQIKNGKAFYLDSAGILKEIDLVTKQTQEVYKPDGKIVDYYPSPDGSKIIVAEENNDSVDNFLIETGKVTQIEKCLAEAIDWVDENKLIANCVKQEWEFDPNTVNNILYYDLATHQTSPVTDLKFEPPHKIFFSKDAAIILTKNSGFKTNDALSLDLQSQDITNLTNKGFVGEIKKTDRGFLALNTPQDSSGELLLITNGRISNQGTADSLNKVTIQRNYIIKVNDNNNLDLFTLDNPSDISKTIEINDRSAVINEILSYAEMIYLFTDKGITSVKI